MAAGERPGPTLRPVVVGVLGLATFGSAMGTMAGVRGRRRAKRRARDLASLDRLAEALSRAEDVDEVADAAAEGIRAAFDAALVLVTLADERAGGLLSVGASGWRNRDAGAEPLLPFDTPTLMTDAFRMDRPLILRTEDYIVRYPHMARSIPDSRIVMAVGRRFSGPRAAGAISMSFADDRAFTPDDDALLERLNSLLPDAFARARSSDRERTSSLTLQEVLLPKDRLTGFDDWQRATRYRPASDEARIGGDWFDIFELGPDRFGIAVGDIVGQGVQAAAVMGQLRSALRALARVADSPGQALDELDRFSSEVDGAFASTALLAAIDARQRTVRIATAGHLPAIVASDGGVVILEGARGAPIGVGTSPVRHEIDVQLDDEDTILFYTDGLVERRGETIDEGLDRLVRIVDAHRHEPLQRLLDLAIDDSAEPAGRDDIAVVALRPVGGRPRTFSCVTSSNGMAIRAVRHDLRRWLETIGIHRSSADDLILAVSEAMTNAMDHAYQGADDGEILVDARLQDDRIELRVRDRGRWAPSISSPIRGRGLSIIAAVTDEVDIDATPRGVEVRMVVARRPDGPA